MMLKLWGRTNSSNVMKVWWLLEELGVSYERTDAGMGFGGNDTPEYRRMSPLGLVPALQDGDFSLFESNTILRYLSDTQAPLHRCYAADPKQRAIIDAWMDVQQTALGPPQGALFVAAIRTPADKRDPKTIAAAVGPAAAMWGLVERQLAAHPYVVGERLTLADMAFGPHVHRWFNMAIERPEMPHLRAWYDRLLARPAYARTCAAPLT